ncbi:hypothetical protein [Intrasporangium calvum]|uniref:Uncharacterized protein n=1 Tax=Intrasporangium calvum (strain ATCC 23552 / DSM 43043 / JCM 3097 / NBRC 12989 / NCIMB 10167 / NRRL B-3866 / 7 KIP) TaxID=710696 RepID=E6SBX2_INTC7|nr:hypothetical protein [Intrasporangium calvum]ADU48481.1 hypothetical protein Intca_1970 [Intrasporangium calvum DSM 43043]
MKDRDLEAEFERIVAGWETEAPDPQGSSVPPSPPPDPSAGAESAPGEASGPAGTPTPAEGRFKDTGLNLPIAPATGHVWRGSEPPREDVDELLDAGAVDDDHFVPPTETDLPTAEEDPMFWAIVGGLGGGTLLLLYILFFDRGGSGWWIVTAVTMIVVGFVLLVLRGGTERDPFDDGTRV